MPKSSPTSASVAPASAAPARASSASQPAVVVRAMTPADAPEVLTDLLHRAYRRQVEMGLRPLAGRQTADVTARRTRAGETFVAELDGKIVGMIVLQELEEAAFPPTFLRKDVAHFSLLAVDPDVQGRGVGQLLIEAVERRAAERGFAELALSMAEPDTDLMRFYLRRGFQLVEHWHWPYTNYRSAILSKPLAR
jgi:GNAT superfamily N-acetyltransferase